MAEFEITKRNLLRGAAIGTVAGTAGFSVSAHAQDLPKSEGSVNMKKALEPGDLPDIALGEPDAPVKIIEYMSMTCPHCATYQKETFPVIKEKFIDTGKVYYIFREFPFDPRAMAAFMLARCAPNGKYLPFVDMMFQQQRTWATAEDGSAAMLQMAKLAGFTQESFQACLTDQKLLDDINAVRTRGADEFEVKSHADLPDQREEICGGYVE